MSKGQAYSLNAQDEEESYRQQLGLKKLLYKYQHQNQQLKTQIKALTERLADILAKKEDQPAQQEKSVDPADQYRLNLLKQELKKLLSQIERLNMEIKSNKQLINQYQELRCVELQNKVKKEQKQIDQYKNKMQKYEKMQKMKGFALQSLDLKNSSLRINTHTDKFRQLQVQLDQTRKNIRELEKFRDTHDKNEIKRQHYVIGLNEQTRKISHFGKQKKDSKQKQQQNGKKGVWNMNYSEQNYDKIRGQLNQLKKQKQRIIQSLKNQYIVLKNRYTELSVQCQELNKSIHLPMIDYPRTKKENKKEKQKAIIQLKDSIDKSRVKTPPKMLNVGPKDFQRNNDKNYSPKKLRKLEWESFQNRTTGIQWNDGHLRSPIIGINLWFDSCLIGIQFLHRLGQSIQHLHLTTKNISPVQYRLSGNDYVQNVCLWISDNQIVGIQFSSKGGRKDGFGNRGKGRKFDFSINDPQKPVFSYGKFRIVNNVSQITKLGFEIV